MKVAVFLPNWIGDVVMATPALLALRRHFVSDQLVGIYRPYVAGVLEGYPWFDEVIEAPQTGGVLQGTWQLAQQVKKQKCDVAILFTNSFRTAWSAWLGNCKHRIGYAREGRTWMLTKSLKSQRDAKGKYKPSPVIDSYNQLAVAAGTSDPGHAMKLFTTVKDQHHANQVWQKFNLKEPVVAMNPGAAFGAAKHWPIEHFASLAKRLVQVKKCNVLVMCGPSLSERQMARQIVDESQCNQVYSLAEENVNLGLLKACVKKADLLVTTDSGPRHFAAAFGTPVVTLFGPTHIEWTETYFPLATNLQKKLPCGPCQQRTCPLNGSYHHRCMRELTPDTVFQAAAALLQHRKGLPVDTPLPMRRAS